MCYSYAQTKVGHTTVIVQYSQLPATSIEAQRNVSIDVAQEEIKNMSVRTGASKKIVKMDLFYFKFRELIILLIEFWSDETPKKT
jgi:hypothetical protein